MKDFRKSCISADATVREAMATLENGGYQIALMTDGDGRLVGVITDGDARRGLIREVGLDAPARAIANPNPVTAPVAMGREARMALMRQRSIRQLPLIDGGGRLVGIEAYEQLARGDGRNWVVLMAGGLGERLRPLTEKTPKPLLEVGGRPLLETTIRTLISQGFWRIFLSVNYRADMIADHFGDGSAFGGEIHYLREDARLGTAGALGLLPSVPEEPIIVMNGDLLTALDFRAFIDFHNAHGGAATIAVREHKVQIPYGVADIDGEYITEIREKPTHTWFINAGIYVLQPSALALIGSGETVDMPTVLHRLVERGEKVAAYPITEYWLDIGRMEDFERALADFPGTFA